jgi:hypothetical protein
MANVYSTLIYSARIATATTTLFGPPPTGNVWVIRDIEAFNNSANAAQTSNNAGGLRIYDNTTLATFFATPPFNSNFGYVYHEELRVVVPAARQLAVLTRDPNWSVHISGYLLSTP